MRLNFVPSAIAILISGLIAFGFYSFNEGENNLVLCVGSFVFLALTLILAIGANYSIPRITINVRTISLIFFATSLMSHLAFSYFDFTIPIYVVVNGIIGLTYVLIVYSISK